MLIGARIKEIRRSKKISQGKLGEALSLGQTAVSNWENGYTTPQARDLEKIAEILGVKIEDLTADKSENILTKIDINPKLNTKLVPFVSVANTAKFVNMIIHNTFEVLEKMPVYYPPGETSADDEIVFEVPDSSMETTIFEKSRVLFEPVKPDEFMYVNSSICAIVFDSQLAIKRIKSNELREKGYLTLHSDNPNAGSIQVPRDQIHSIWKAIDIVRQRLK